MDVVGSIKLPSDYADPSTYDEGFCLFQIPTILKACDGTGDTDDQKTADYYKAFEGMCDDGDGGGCDKKYANAKKCTDALGDAAALGDSPTADDIDACCAGPDDVTTLYGKMKAACSEQTTFVGQDCSYEGHTCLWIGEDVEESCDYWLASLNGGGATTAVSGLAIAAAGVAILNVL